MADDPYVPIGGWDAAGYAGFSPDYAAQTVQPQVNYGNIQQAAANQGVYQQASTPTYQLQQPQFQGSYAQLRGYSNDPSAMGNSGPQLLGGNYGSLMSHAALYPTTGGPMHPTHAPAPTPSPFGDLSGVPGMTPPNSFGDLSGSNNFSTLPGGDYNDTFNVPTNGPFGDLSGAPQVSIDTGFQPPSQPYQMPTTPTTFGNLSGSNGAATGGAQLAANHPLDLHNFVNSYSGGSPTDPRRAAALARQAPSQPGIGVQMPQITTPNTYGGSPLDVAPSSLYDQTYMDLPQGSYGSLMGGPDHDSQTTYESMTGSPLAPPSPAINTAPQNPNTAMFTPTATHADGGASFSQPAPMSHGQMFAQGLSTPQSSNYQTAFGGLNRTFMPQPDVYNTNKLVNRIPQDGGFVSYGAGNRLSPAQNAISRYAR